jgi:hypothetical protein
MRVSEHRVLRRFGPKREEVMGGWRRLYNEELHNLYDLPNVFMMIKSRRMNWAGDVWRMGKMRNAYIILVGNLKGRDHSEDLVIDGKIVLELHYFGWKPEGKRPLGRPRHKWEDNIKITIFWLENVKGRHHS